MRLLKRNFSLLMTTLLVISCNKTEESGLTVKTLAVTNDQGNLITMNALVSGSSSGGFVYSTIPGPTIDESEQAVASSFVDTMVATAIVEPGTTYYIRAYAWENSFDVVYGNEIIHETGFAIGQEHEGGVIAYLFEEGDPGYVSGEQHGLIVAKDLIGTDIAWGCEGTSIAGATAMEIGSGQSNTDAIVSGCGEAGTAAVLCNDLVVDGYDDWYLPSHDELKAIDKNEAWLDDISNGWYLTSTQKSADLAWRVYFWPEPSLTLPDGWYKNNGMKVMAVRTF